VVARECRLEQHDAVLGREPLTHGRERLHRVDATGDGPVTDADAGHHAHALRLDEDLTLGVLRRANGRTEEVVRAAEPGAIPTVALDRGSHRGCGLPIARR